MSLVFPSPPADRDGVIDLDVGIIYTHEDAYMPRLLSTLAASAPGLRMRLLLVDNASGQGTAAWERIVPETVVLRNPRPLGYAANLNRVLEEARGRYVLLMNTDMYFDPQARCLSQMVEFLDGQPDCGLAGCRIYHGDGSYAWPARRFQTLKTFAARRLRLALVVPGELRRYFYQDQDLTGTFECDWLSGCFLVVRREAAEQIGGFDEGFRKYYEDVDYCLRMSRADWRVMFYGGTYCYHLEQRASRRLLTRDGWLHFRSYLRWVQKWGWQPSRGERAA
jgi:GT2 family glycosyltransferase